MKEITITRFHDILYKFFAVLSCLGAFILSMDIIAIIHHYPLYLVGRPVSGYYIIIPIALDMLMIILCYRMARLHFAQWRKTKWR